MVSEERQLPRLGKSHRRGCSMPCYLFLQNGNADGQRPFPVQEFPPVARENKYY